MNVVVFCPDCLKETPATIQMRQLCQPYDKQGLLIASGQRLDWRCPECGKEYEIEMEFEESGCKK